MTQLGTQWVSALQILDVGHKVEAGLDVTLQGASILLPGPEDLAILAAAKLLAKGIKLVKLGGKWVLQSPEGKLLEGEALAKGEKALATAYEELKAADNAPKLLESSEQALERAQQAYKDLPLDQKDLLRQLGSGVEGAANAPATVPQGLTADSIRIYRDVINKNLAVVGDKAAPIVNARNAVLDNWLGQLLK